ncbi:NAD(P)-binding protein [Schizopora paradoxa]|uniref:NAD(P)-binding protein n=1 Tax=Schizopora paradoxa TaxID=27342 RepID=A0A0H2RRU0_9AGAM|nr:NAD(P)-binding protein [Schizopora paradoxa]
MHRGYKLIPRHRYPEPQAMASGIAPKEYHSVYPAIAPEKLVGALEGKVALVTGAGRGLGKAISLTLAHAGAHVALLARTKAQLDEVAQEIETKYHRKTLVLPVDVTIQSDVAAAFEKTENGLNKLDILVANAGMVLWRPFVFCNFDEDFWRVMEVNFRAPLFIIQLAMKSMRERSSGTIIATSSLSVLQSFPGIASYTASKVALDAAIGALQKELDAPGESGIQMYAVNPGLVKTEIFDGYKQHEEELEKMKPGTVKWWDELLENPTETSELWAQTCVYLAAGKAKELRGRHIDVFKDIESIVEQSEIVKRENLYEMGVRQLGG